MNEGLSAVELINLHVEVLLPHTSSSRIEYWNGENPSPRFYLGRTVEGNIWRFRMDLSDEICEELEGLCKTEPADAHGQPKHEDAFKRILSGHGPIERIWCGPDFWFSDGVPPSSGAVAIDQDNASLLQGELEGWTEEVSKNMPLYAIVEESRAVSVCGSVAVSEVVQEAGVETLATHQRRGYATKVVSAWASAVERLGAKPMYSTSWENAASRGVASRLGLSMYGSNFHIT